MNTPMDLRSSAYTYALIKTGFEAAQKLLVRARRIADEFKRTYTGPTSPALLEQIADHEIEVGIANKAWTVYRQRLEGLGRSDKRYKALINLKPEELFRIAKGEPNPVEVRQLTTELKGIITKFERLGVKIDVQDLDKC